MVLIIEGKKSPSPWEPRCSDDWSDILAGLLWPLDKNLCFVCYVLPDRRIDCKMMQHLCYFSAQLLMLII